MIQFDMPELIGRDPCELASLLLSCYPGESWRVEVTGPQDLMVHHDEGSIVYDLWTGAAADFSRTN